MARMSPRNVMKLLDEAKEALTPDQCFLHDLKRSIELSDKAVSRTPSQMYKPSSMNCIRNMYYQRLGYKQDESVSPYNLIQIANAGTDIHVRIQTAVQNMKEMGMSCEYIDVAQFIKTKKLKDIEFVSQTGMETKLKNTKYNMSFMCDGIIKYKRKYYILEIKSEMSTKFYKRNGVDPAHYNQATAYSISFGLDNVIFVYISRDTLEMKAFMFTPTGDQKQDLIGMITDCEGYVKRKIAPPKSDVNVKTCQYCRYKSYCEKDG